MTFNNRGFVGLITITITCNLAGQNLARESLVCETTLHDDEIAIEYHA